ncbi:MAG: hypothetical protein ACI9W6_000207 [Motiliproteus sp.]|jgi:hypothetical protein
MRIYSSWTLLFSVFLYVLPSTTALAATKERGIRLGRLSGVGSGGNIRGPFTNPTSNGPRGGSTTVPEEGTNLWVDYFALGGKGREPALASAFLNFINEPENAAEMAQYLYYATPNQAAEKYLPAEFLANPTIYPTATTLDRSEFYQPIEPRALRRKSAISARILR